MHLLRFRLRTLMLAVPIAGVGLALTIQMAAWVGSVTDLLLLVVLLSIAWVPAVLVFLPPKAAGWLFLLAVSASVLSLAFAVYHPATADTWPERRFSACVAILWVTLGFGIGYVATKAIHLPERRRGPDSRSGIDSDGSPITPAKPLSNE